MMAIRQTLSRQKDKHWQEKEGKSADNITNNSLIHEEDFLEKKTL